MLDYAIENTFLINSYNNNNNNNIIIIDIMHI
jgi:hypothetical protein